METTVQTTVRRPRVTAPSPARWQAALNRAIAGNVRVMQVESTGQWIATSASQAGVAYELAVTGRTVHGCSCLAGLNDDEVCVHRAAWLLAAGLLDPEPAAPTTVYSGTFAGQHRTVTVVERTHQRGTWDIIDYERKQKLGGGGSLDFIRNRLQEAGFAPVPATAAA